MKKSNTTEKITFVKYLSEMGLSATSVYETPEGYYAEILPLDELGKEIDDAKIKRAFTSCEAPKGGTILCRLAKADASNPDIVGPFQVDGVYPRTFAQYLAELGFLPENIGRIYETSLAYYAEVPAHFVNPAYFTEVRYLGGGLNRVNLTKEDAANPAIVGQNRISGLFSVIVYKTKSGRVYRTVDGGKPVRVPVSEWEKARRLTASRVFIYMDSIAYGW